MTARALLSEVAKVLAMHGRVSVKFGTILELDGVLVAQVNASNALVITGTFRGLDVAVPARNVRFGETAEQISTEILDRREVVKPVAA